MSVTVDPAGKFAYAANYYSNNISVYAINQTIGALTAGAAVAAGASPISVTVDHSGKFAYVANEGTNNIYIYAINQTTGALTATNDYPVDTGSSPNSITTAIVGASALTGQPIGVVTGWNLLGNSGVSPIDVAATFGDTTKFTTVWKWNTSASKWAFYTPSMTASSLATYAAGKGYDVLTSISSKEGFWVNALAAAALTGPTAGGVTLAASDLQSGWNLMGSADNKTPSLLNQGLSSSLSTAGKAIVTTWAWNASNANWKFYAPSLEAQGGTALADYISGKGYLPFSAVLSAADGFWLNIGAAGTTGGGAPTITGISPITAAAGAAVTITGTNFSTTTANNTVKFSGVQAAVTAATTTSLNVTVPSGAPNGTVSVATSGGTATSAGSFTVSSGAGSVLPAGYVSQGGLTWMVSPSYVTYTNATALCAGTTINGATSRLPTKAELSALYASAAVKDLVSLDYYWSSTPYRDGSHYLVALYGGDVQPEGDQYYYSAVCVS